MLGVAAGAVAFAGSAAAQLVISGLASGVIVGGIDGTALLSSPQPGWSAGVVVVVVAGLLTLARDAWWRSPIARTAAGVIAATGIVAGVLRFYPGYLVELGTRSIWTELLVSGAQSTASYVFVALIIVTAAFGHAGSPREASTPRTARR